MFIEKSQKIRGFDLDHRVVTSVSAYCMSVLVCLTHIHIEKSQKIGGIEFDLDHY